MASDAQDIRALLKGSAEEPKAGSLASSKDASPAALPPLSAAGRPTQQLLPGGGGSADAGSRPGSSPASTDSGEMGDVAVHAQHAQHAQQRRLPGFSRQLAVMFWRTWTDIIRNPTLLRLHVGMAALMGVTTGLVFWQLEPNNVGVQNRMGGTFFALAFLGFTSLTTVDLLINERAVAVREVRGGYYKPTTYLMAKLALDASECCCGGRQGAPPSVFAAEALGNAAGGDGAARVMMKHFSLGSHVTRACPHSLSL